MQGYDEYLEEVAEFISNQSLPRREKSMYKEPPIVVVCGGKTDKDYPDISEAETVLESLKAKTKGRVSRNIDRILFYKEENSESTVENIVLAVESIWNSQWRGDYCFICDKVRKWKVKAICRFVCKTWGIKNYRVYGFKRSDDHPHSNAFYQFGQTLRYYCFPRLIRREIEAMRERMKST